MSAANPIDQMISRHSHKVKFAKWLLIGVIVLMLSALVLTAVFHKENERFNLTYQSLEDGREETPAMINPKLQGVDVKGRPYRVVAEKAEQLGPEKVKLYQLESALYQKDKPLNLSADSGVVEVEKQQLALSSNIHFRHGEDFQMTTESAQVDFKQGTVMGDSAIYGVAPMGTLQAARFRATEGGNVIITRLPTGDKDEGQS
jgi:hypothetical protein